MKKLFLFLFISCVTFSSLLAQQGRDETLAASYMQNGENDKAAELYQQLLEKNNYDTKFYPPLYRCLLTLKRFDDLEKVVKRLIKKYEGTPQFLIDLGYLYSQIPNAEKAKEQYEKALKEVKPTETAIRSLANSFEAYQLFDYAIATYDKGAKLLKVETYFSFETAQAYLGKNDLASAVKYYLLHLEANPYNIQNIKNTIQTSRNAPQLLEEMETQLYSKVQKSGNNEDYIDLLTWVYIQNKDFDGALTQMKALDKRKGENGFRVINIARMALAEGDYDNAIAGFEYILGKGIDNALYFPARTELLNCRKEKVSKNLNYTQQDLLALKNEYLLFINENERSFRTAPSIKELADLEGFYLHDINAAIALCNEVIGMNGVGRQLKNQTKLSLGDFYLIDGNIWEATLIYSQVDKDEKDSPLGEEARFRNAKLAYFNGDFDWAQTQLDALKGSTSELISNDAINLSVFIIDNLGLDTTEYPMKLFANAELLIYQNKFAEALQTFDSIIIHYPAHVLYDDILFAKAQVYVRRKDFLSAVPLLEEIIANYKQDLKGDDATFLLADINESYLHNKEKAKELYQSIITDYSSSILIVEARKRFRLLRGDVLFD